MGRGKKAKADRHKKDEKPQGADEIPISELSLSAEQPSTSAEASTAPLEPEPTPKPPEEEDEGGLGLGLGKSRKKKPPKKKKSAEPAPAQPQDLDKKGSGDRPPSGSFPGAPTAAPAPAWGAKPGTQPSDVISGPPGFVPTQLGLSQAAPPGFQPGPPSSQTGPPSFQPGPPGAQSPPATNADQQPGPQPTQQPAFPGLQTGHRGPQPTYPGPQEAYPGPQQAYPGPHQAYPGPTEARQPTYPGQRPGVPQQAGPSPWQTQAQPQYTQRLPVATTASQPSGSTSGPRGPPPQQRPSGPPVTVASHGDVRKSPSETVCRFKIPDKVPARPGFVPARTIRVLTNYLEMTIEALKIHRYDVSFKPDKPKKMIPKAFILAKNKLYKNRTIAFDQMKNCYTLEPLPNVTQSERFCTTVEIVDNNGRTMTFEVSFKGTGIVDIGTILNHMKVGGSSLNPPTEAIQCIDVILRQGTLENYIKAGRQFFKRPSNPINLGDGLEMWTGLFQSAIFTHKAFVNIDVAHKGFPKQQSMIDALSRDFRLDPNGPIDRRGRNADAFVQFTKGLRVVATIGGDVSARGQKREFICNELVDPPGHLTFIMNDPSGKPKTMTVLEYFTKVKNVRLRYPNLNCMWVGVRDKKIYYPLELLEISYGQALNRQLNESQLSTMVREAATPPDERKRKIEEVIRDMNYSRNTYFKQFGLNINNTFFEVEAKVLDAPNLDIGGNRTVQPAKGAWQANRLLKPEALEAWALIAIELDMSQSCGENIISLLKSVGGQMGMSVREPLERFYNTPMRSLRETLFKAAGRNCKFVTIIVPTRGRDYYHKVKQLAERDVGILTQCIKEYTATRRMNQQTARNILLKVNSKMMGINQALDKRSMPACLGGGVMVVGADVTHPSPDQSAVPSIAAVTASIDPKCFFSYNIQLSIQTPKKEMIVEFEDMMVEHLKVYMRSAGALPRKIFVFRDGVSEGQFAQVMNSELQAVHRAYQRMTGDPKKKPEVLFLLVQKRHHTRLFQKDPRNAQYNVAPGTVVDKDVVHPKELDFYLVSHQAIKGTARPTRYHAVCNDGHIPHDEVEQLTYYLCHLYSRCMRAVSYPTPTYYAHLACLRARSLTYGERFNNQDLERKPKRLNVLDKMLESSRMFFV